MYVLQLLRFLGHDIACPIGYLIDCSAVEELSKRNSEPPGEHFLCWFHHFRSKRRPCNRCESCDEVCSKSYFFNSKLTILDFDAARGNRQRQPLDDAVTGRVITA
jgi:hypothetical protein